MPPRLPLPVPASGHCPGPSQRHRDRQTRSPPCRRHRHSGFPPSARGNTHRRARDTARPSGPNNFATIASSRSCAYASRWLARPPFLPNVISFSATGRSSFAFGSVVVICSCLINAAARLRNMAWRCADVTRELPAGYPVTHVPLLLQNGSSIRLARSSMFSGGQPATVMPSPRPIEPSTSLISFSDFRPKFGVRSISCSDFCTRSPM